MSRITDTIEWIRKIDSIGSESGALMIDTRVNPYGHTAFGGIPGAIVRGPEARALAVGNPGRWEALVVHEKVHWRQWAQWTAPSFVILLGLALMTDSPWWLSLGSLLVFPSLYLSNLFNLADRWEQEADNEQRRILDLLSQDPDTTGDN